MEPYNNTMIIALDKHKKPLGFVTEKRAKQLLDKKKAVVHRLIPFIIRLKKVEAEDCVSFGYTLKIDPGSKYTGIAVLDPENRVMFWIEIEHRARSIVDALSGRNGNRRGRRSRDTGYRKPKFTNI